MKTIAPLFRLIYFLFIVLPLAGCVSGSTRVDLSKIDAPPPGKANIFVIRPDNHYGKIIDLWVIANNTKVAVLSDLSYTSFLKVPGKLELSSSGSNSLNWPNREITIDVAEGQTYYIAWVFTGSDALMVIPILALTINPQSFRWESLTEADAQKLLDSTNHVEPIVREIP